MMTRGGRAAHFEAKHGELLSDTYFDVIEMQLSRSSTSFTGRQGEIAHSSQIEPTK